MPDSPLFGGTDMGFSVLEEPDYTVLTPGSSTFAPGGNTDEDAAFLLHDVAVVKLSEPVVLDEWGSLPELNYLDTYYSKQNKQQALFESVGYGLEGSGPKTAFGGDTRKKADRRLVSFQGVYGDHNIAVKFSHATNGTTTSGTCFGDSGGPTFDISTPEIEAENVIVAVTSFGMTQTCTSSGGYRIDQADDLAFLAAPDQTEYSS